MQTPRPPLNSGHIEIQDVFQWKNYFLWKKKNLWKNYFLIIEIHIFWYMVDLVLKIIKKARGIQFKIGRGLGVGSVRGKSAYFQLPSSDVR